MNISHHTCNRLRNINWFSSVGEQCVISNVKPAGSLSEANEYLNSPEWENVTLEESNNISGYLAVKYTVIFQEWNKLAKEAKTFLKNELMKKFPDLSGFDNKLLSQCIEWDVVHYSQAT